MSRYRVILDITRTHLSSRIKQSSIAALGVTFGIGTFIVLMSFMTGLNNLLDGLILNRTPHVRIYNEIEPSDQQPIELSDAFSDAWNVVRSVKPKNSQERIHNALPLIAKLEKDERVKGVSPQVNAPVFYLSGNIELNGVINGINPLEEKRLFNFGDYITKGSPDDLAKSRNGILIGAGIADKMSLSIGDRVQVSTARGALIPLKVIGIFQSGLAEVDNVQSYVNLSMGQQLLGEGKSYITDINLKLFNIEDAVPMSEEIRQKYKVSAVDIKTANAQFETGTDIRNLITYAVSVTLLIVAGFGIYNILNMLIYEKMNDIAILKATGFSGDDVKLIFISQALLIGLIGGLIGLVIGFGLSVLIDRAPFETEALPTIKTFPVNFDPGFYLIGITFAVISTFLAGYLPARKARKIDPVEIIRGQ
mgnify:FL=1